MSDIQSEATDSFTEPADIVFEDEPVNNKGAAALGISSEHVSARDIFKLAKYILAVAAVLYFIVGGCRIFLGTEGVKEVWEFSKVFLSSIISLVLGLYFGHGHKKE